jgi:Mg-chelatase subunit ChlD
MFNRAFTKFLDKKPIKKELYPYLYSIAFKELGKPKNETTDEPIKCKNCEAVFTDVNLIQVDSQKGSYYVCEFCGTINTIDKSKMEKKHPNDIDFILIEALKKGSKKEEKITKVDTTEGDLYISVIDISGSMSGAKIEAVKKSLCQTLRDFKINSPTTKYVLVAFESSVYYYLRHDQNPFQYHGDLLFSLEGMKQELKTSIKKDKFIGSIGEFADGWIKKVESLTSMDMTALGPALYFAINTFELLNHTGRITLLTDGLANQGIGNLSGTSPGAEKFYENMAELCNQNNIIIDVVGVSASGDNNEMGLQTLGKLTDKTGGTLYLISSEEMEVIFSELRQMKYIGKDVKVKIIVPPSINIKNITGAYSSKGAIKGSDINLGAITEDRELFLELESSKAIVEKEEVPIQLQVEYIDNKGRKRMRVINDRVKVTKDEDEFKSQYDQKFNVMMNIQAAGGGYFAGKAEESKDRLRSLKNEMLGELNQLKSSKMTFNERDFSEGLAYLNDELEEIDMEEEKAAQAPTQSYWAVKGQKRARMSLNTMKKRMEKKKK